MTRRPSDHPPAASHSNVFRLRRVHKGRGERCGSDAPELIDERERLLPPLGRRSVGAAVLLISLFATVFTVIPLRKRSMELDTIAQTDMLSAPIGHHAYHRLRDGSEVDLSSGTTLVVTYSKDARWLDLLEGEAYFQVQHDARRPFRVASGQLVTRSLGTEFDVLRRRDGSTRILVKEGHVRIETVQATAETRSGASGHSRTAILDLHASEYVEIAADDINTAKAGHLTRDTLDTLLNWRGGAIVFANQPLAQVLAQLETFYGVQFDLQDGPAREVNVGVVAQPGDLAGFLASLQPATCLRATTERTSDKTIVHLNRASAGCLRH